jgi:uncharacterized protein YeaO (DUF488 family)
MAIRIVRLGTARFRDEGLRLGTVRRPPRGVRRDRYAVENWYDVWLPNLAPSAALLTIAKHIARDSEWKKFAARYEKEMAKPDASHLLDLLAALSQHASFSVGCYCEDESRCHRSILARLLKARGALLVGSW